MSLLLKLALSISIWFGVSILLAVWVGVVAAGLMYIEFVVLISLESRWYSFLFVPLIILLLLIGKLIRQINKSE